MGIIKIYRSSATHWYKFGVHTLCCSRDRAVFPISKTAFLEMEPFSLGKIGKTALSREVGAETHLGGGDMSAFQSNRHRTVPEIHSRLYKFIYNGTYA